MINKVSLAQIVFMWTMNAKIKRIISFAGVLLPFLCKNKLSGCHACKTYIRGYGNNVKIDGKSKLKKPVVRIIGNNNTFSMGDNCRVGPKCSFWIVGDNCEICIGGRCTFNNHVHIFAQEDNSRIVIGNDCMIANNIIIRTSDSHPIYDSNTGLRLNAAKNIFIGNHVWIAPWARIMKGVVVKDGAIIASNAVVTKDVPQNCIVAGVPSREVKYNVMWKRHF